MTREGTSDPSRPEPSEVSGADKDARAATVAPARREEGGETGGASRPQRGRGRGSRDRDRGRVRGRSRSPAGLDEARRVNSAISSTRSLAELRDVVEANDDARRFNVVNVATAFSRLGRHLSDDQRGTLDGQAWYLALETRTLALLPELSGWAASSVTWSLARAERDPGAAFWEALERTLIARASELEPQGVANVLWAFAVMGRRAPPALRNALEAAAARFCGGPAGPEDETKNGDSRTSTFKPYEMTMAFWALTRFGEAPSSDVLDRFERRLPYVMARLKPKELANVASAYGRAGGGGGVLPKLAERCAFETGLLSRFAPHEFATLLWGLAKAECAPLISMKVLERFRVFLSRNVVRFDDPRDVSLALWALATLHPKPTRPLSTRFALDASTEDGSTKEAGQFAIVSKEAVNRKDDKDSHDDSDSWLATTESAIVARRNLRSYNPQDLSNTLWAFAKFERVPGAAFQEEFEEAALAKMHAFNAQSLANVAYAYAALALPGAATVLPLVSEHLERKLGRIATPPFVETASNATDAGSRQKNAEDAKSAVTAVELVMVLWAYARCGFDPGPETMARVETACACHVSSMQPDELTQYLWASASLRYRPNAAFLAAAERRAERAPARFGAEAVTLTLWAYATLGLAPGEALLERFADELDAAEAPGGIGFGEKGGAFKPQDLSLGFWSAAVLASQPRREPPLRATPRARKKNEKEKQKEGQVFRVVRAYAKHLPSLTPQSVSPEGLSAVFAATLALDAVAPETRAALAPAWRALAGPAEAAWRATKTRDPTVSKLQEDVGRVLRQMGVPHELEKPVFGGLIRPDFALTETFEETFDVQEEAREEGGSARKTLSGFSAYGLRKTRGVVVEVDGPYHYSREPSFGVFQTPDSVVEDWFSGGSVGGDLTERAGVPEDAPRGVGRAGDGGWFDGGGRWPLGSTVLRNQLMRAWGMTVVTVTYHEWERLGTARAKREHIAGLLERAAREDEDSRE